MKRRARNQDQVSRINVGVRVDKSTTKSSSSSWWCVKQFITIIIALILNHTTISTSQVSHSNNQQQHSYNNLLLHSKQHNPTSSGYNNFTISNRPLDRPNLPPTKNASGGHFETDWLTWGVDDLAPSESKVSSPVYSSSSSSSDSKSNKKRKSHGNSKNSSRTTTTFDDEQSEASDSNEVFDDVEEGASTLAGTQKEPECASQGRYYCTYKEEYPLKLVTEVTKYYKWPLEKLFRDLHAQIMPKLAQDSSGNLVCDSITRVVRPGWARNTNDRWLVVINTENYHQYVTEVVCQYGTNSRCNFIPPCYYSSCQQRYNTQKLLVIDPTNPYRGPFLSEFLFPSCCVCYVPTASDTFQDKYRPSPATIYQRTMQQESSSNMYPPQFRPTSLIEEVPGAINEQQQAASLVRASSTTGGGGGGGGLSISSGSSSSSAQGKQSGSNNQVPSPGEIRRGGDQYRRTGDGGGGGGKHDISGNEMVSDFPRLGLADSLINQQSNSNANVRQ